MGVHRAILKVLIALYRAICAAYDLTPDPTVVALEAAADDVEVRQNQT